jgi:hypothetical protein
LGGFAAAGDNRHITVELLAEKNTLALSQEALQALHHSEGYQIEITGEGIRILAADELGALHGLVTLESFMINGKGQVKKGRILDWPDHKVRAFHATVGTTNPEKMQRFISMARFGHFNTFVLQISNDVRFASMAKAASAESWTVEQFLHVVNYARQHGLNFVPEIRTLTHLKWFLEHYPSIRYNASTYDPRKEETYAIILPILDEVITLIRPKAVHIGHDEAAGHSLESGKKWLRAGETMLPKELFLMDVLRLHNYLAERGVETWMWGDMLVSPAEFPGMLARHLHGAGGYASIRAKIPRDIVIVDWHYADKQADFPSALAFLKEGHKVIGATWRKEETMQNFSRYLFRIAPGATGGMMATTWKLLHDNDWGAIETVLAVSAENFWNAK